MSQASAHANTEFEYIATSIDAFTKAAGLPLYNLRDISYDLSTIMRHNTDFIWVLREQGTVIEPIRRGVNPAIPASELVFGDTVCDRCGSDQIYNSDGRNITND